MSIRNPDLDERRFYVYAYLDPRYKEKHVYESISQEFDYRPIYIGKGTDNRCYKHLYQPCNIMLTRILEKLKNLNLDPIIIKIRENLTDEEALSYEIDCIKAIGRRWDKAGPLANFTNGGDGNSGLPKEIRAEATRKIWRNLNSRENMLRLCRRGGLAAASDPECIKARAKGREKFNSDPVRKLGRVKTLSPAVWIYLPDDNILIYQGSATRKKFLKDFKDTKYTYLRLIKVREIAKETKSRGNKLTLSLDGRLVYATHGDNSPTIFFKHNQKPSRVIICWFPEGSTTIEKLDMTYSELSRVHSSEWKWGDSEFSRGIEDIFGIQSVI